MKPIAILLCCSFILTGCLLNPYAPTTHERGENFNEAVMSTFVIGKTTFADVVAAWGSPDKEDDFSHKQNLQADARRRDGNWTRSWQYSQGISQGGRVTSYYYKTVTLMFDGKSETLLGITKATNNLNVPAADLKLLEWKEPAWWKDPNWQRQGKIR